MAMKILRWLPLLLWPLVAKPAVPDVTMLFQSTNGLYNFRPRLSEIACQPNNGYQVWYLNSAAWTWSTLSNYMIWGTNYLHYKMGGYTESMITDNWADHGGRVNGHLVADATHLPLGLAATCRLGHKMGYVMGLFFMETDPTAGGMPGSFRTNIATDVLDAYNAGFDYIRVDIGGGVGTSNLMYMLDDLRIWRSEMDKLPKPMWLMTSGWNDQIVPDSCVTNDIGRHIMNVANVVQFSQDARADGFTSMQYWTNIMERFHAVSKFAKYVKPGHLLMNDHPILHTNGPASSAFPVNVGWANIGLDCMLACVIHADYPYADNRQWAMTNADFQVIQRDPLCIAARPVSTNFFAECWARPLQGNRIAVCMFNSTTNQSTNITFQFQWMGWPSNTVASVRDCMTNQNWASPVTNGMTLTLPAMCFSNYILTPVLNY